MSSPNLSSSYRLIELNAARDAMRYKAFWVSGVAAHGWECFRMTAEDDAAEGFPTTGTKASFTLAAVDGLDGPDETADILGVVSFRPETPGRALLVHKGLVCRMYVASGANGRGIGSTLLAELIRRVTTDCPHIYSMNLQVVATNDRARSLYERFGFVRYGTERNAYRKTDGTFKDEDLMQKFIERDTKSISGATEGEIDGTPN
jgi:ribosomal protein S18 acetylase RimI-like enzyme